MDKSFGHQPVLLKEVLEGLNIKSQGKYVDGTFGRGGHAQAILQQLDAQGRLLVIDKDPQAIETANQMYAGDERVVVARGSFAMLRKLTADLGWTGQVDGILLDLGVSSPQLDDPDRGFSFRNDGALDMRMDPAVGRSAAEWLSSVSERELATVLRDYGEERFAKRIARAIVKERADNPIKSTRQLASIIAKANPKWEMGKDPATRSFQAIRIFVNNELADLQAFLGQVVDVLKVKGRLVIISFHSLEDRIVKRFIRDKARGDDFPPDLPVQYVQLTPTLKAVGKAVYPSEMEIDQNPRARSSVMRIAEKLPQNS